MKKFYFLHEWSHQFPIFLCKKNGILFMVLAMLASGEKSQCAKDAPLLSVQFQKNPPEKLLISIFKTTDLKGHLQKDLTIRGIDVQNADLSKLIELLFQALSKESPSMPLVPSGEALMKNKKCQIFSIFQLDNHRYALCRSIIEAEIQVHNLAWAQSKDLMEKKFHNQVMINVQSQLQPYLGNPNQVKWIGISGFPFHVVPSNFLKETMEKKSQEGEKEGLTWMWNPLNEYPCEIFLPEGRSLGEVVSWLNKAPLVGSYSLNYFSLYAKVLGNREEKDPVSSKSEAPGSTSKGGKKKGRGGKRKGIRLRKILIKSKKGRPKVEGIFKQKVTEGKA